MSESLQEIIDRESEEAEEAETIQGDDDDTESEDEDEDAEARAERVAEAERAIDHDVRDRALQKQDTTHTNALKRIYGDDFAKRTRCGVCDGEGLVEPSPELLHFLVEQGQQARAALGEMGGNLKQAPWARTCETCDGETVLLTGAREEHNLTIVCEDCGGKGWIDKREEERRAKLGVVENGSAHPPVVYPVYHGLEPTPPAQQAAPQSPPDGWESAGRPNADLWGRWPGHMNYGRDPSVGGW